MKVILPFVSLMVLLATGAKEKYNAVKPPFHIIEKLNKEQLGFDEKNGKIVGGEEAEEGRYPYMVSLLQYDFPFCGGTLIDPEWVLSAAHCACRATHILIGHHTFDEKTSTVQNISVTYEVKHPSYDAFSFDYDIMLMKLSEAVSFETISLNTDQDISEGTDVTVIGWGRTFYEGPVSDVLLEVEIQTVSNKNCADAYIELSAYGVEVTDQMMCAAGDGKGSCQGDSGGPLMIKGSDASSDVQLGIVSWAYRCAEPNYPTVFATLDGMNEFINNTIENDSPSPFPGGFNYSECYVDTPCSIGDGKCDYSEYNSTECNYDGGDCVRCDFPLDGFNYSECKVETPCWIGDDYCDSGAYDTKECNYDGGDCGFFRRLLILFLSFCPCFFT